MLLTYSQQTPRPSLALDHDLCTGVPIVWPDDMRPFVMLFPWERYHNGQDALPFTIDTRDPSALYARSKSCVVFTPHEGTPCHNCADVHEHVAHLIKIAQDPKPNTNYRFLGLGHLQDLLKASTEQVKHLKLQVYLRRC